MGETGLAKAPPPGWGGDDLTAFLEIARHNRFATFVQRPQAFAKFLGIDGCFSTISNGWMNPQSHVGSLLFLRTHAHFRAGCEHAMAAQLAETFVLGRATLEAAAYALHICLDPRLGEVWLRRHDDKEHEKQAKAAFSVGKLRDSIRKVDRGADTAFEGLYQLSIDMGGHPNERSITVSTARERVPAGTAYKHFFFHDDPLRIDFVLRSLAQIGVCALLILQGAFSARFELLGVRSRLLHLRQGL